jgi:hypothetical protein
MDLEKMTSDKNKIISRSQTLIALACLISGLQAGGNIYRYLIEVPAWRQLSIVNWGEYSRNADLKNGIILFPLQAISAFLLLITVSIIAVKNKDVFRNTSLWIHAASVFALLGLGLTFFAAPIMLSVKTMGNDPELLQEAFNRFHFWGSLRGVVQVLSFIACIIAMARIFKLKS